MSPAFSPSESTIALTHIDGSRPTGTLEALSDEFVTLAGRGGGRFSTSDLVSISFPVISPVRTRGGAVVQLANGDRLFVEPQQIDENLLSGTWIHFPTWPRISIPLEAIRGMAFAKPSEYADSREILKLSTEQSRGADLLVLINGDRITGELSQFGDNRFLVETDVGPREIVRADVRILAFDSELISFPKASPKRALLRLSDGSRLTAGRFRLLDGGRLSFEALFGAEMTVPVSALVSLQILGGRAVYLSDLEPDDYQHTPFLSTHWPLKRDLSANGAPLQLRGTEYAKGLGMHSKSSVTYRLDGEYRRFQAVIGIDDSTRGRGSATFAVEVDGRRVFTSNVLTGKNPPETIGPMDVTGAKLLTLSVGFADFGDIQDRADWCDALVIK